MSREFRPIKTSPQQTEVELTFATGEQGLGQRDGGFWLIKPESADGNALSAMAVIKGPTGWRPKA